MANRLTALRASGTTTSRIILITFAGLKRGVKTHGHSVINPALDDDDFAAAARTAQAEYDQHKPDVIVGSSRGGAVAVNMHSGDTPLVLLCPAWKNWGTVTTVKPNRPNRVEPRAVKRRPSPLALLTELRATARARLLASQKS